MSRVPSIAVSYECTAERLLAEIAAACASQTGFAERVQAALRAALAIFTAEPELARLLTAEPHPEDEIAIRRHRRAKERYGAMLRRAAGEDPDLPSRPSFLEPLLIGGVSSLISRSLLAGKTAELEELLQFVFVYYPGRRRTTRHVRANRVRAPRRS